MAWHKMSAEPALYREVVDTLRLYDIMHNKILDLDLYNYKESHKEKLFIIRHICLSCYQQVESYLLKMKYEHHHSISDTINEVVIDEFERMLSMASEDKLNVVRNNLAKCLRNLTVLLEHGAR